LPARDLKLSDSWSPAKPEFRVGEPVTRTITMQAQGLSAAQLPELALGDLPEVKFYPDQPVTQDDDDGEWITGTRQQKIAMVPAKAGDYVLPEVVVHWWDTEADRERVAKLPARSITVLPALNQAPVVPAPAPAAQAESEPAPAAVDVAPAPELGWQNARYWVYVASILFIAWLVTLVAWLRARRQAVLVTSPDKASEQDMLSIRRAKQALEKACNANDATAARTALLDWAKARYPQEAFNSLGSLAGGLNAEELKQQILALDAVLYSGTKSEWQGAELWRTAKPVLERKPGSLSAHSQALKPLYPAA